MYVRVKEEIDAIIDSVTSKKSPNPEMHVNKDGNFIYASFVCKRTLSNLSLIYTNAVLIVKQHQLLSCGNVILC